VQFCTLLHTRLHGDKIPETALQLFHSHSKLQNGPVHARKHTNIENVLLVADKLAEKEQILSTYQPVHGYNCILNNS
jgi:hypothetical protein